MEYLTFGSLLQQTRTHFLPDLGQLNPPLRNALVLGDGDGRFTAALLRANPQIRVHAVDLSPAMIQSLQQAAGPHQARLTTEIADLRHWSPSRPPASPLARPPAHQPAPAGRVDVPSSGIPTCDLPSYDLIATHFFLDCLTTAEVTSLASRLRPYAAPKALWLISDFAVPPTLFGRWFARPIVALLYRAFRMLAHLNLLELPDHSSALQRSGWTIQVHHRRLRGLLISQLWSTQPSAPADSTRRQQPPR
jgi:SAM-dependent methyltransferase